MAALKVTSTLLTGLTPDGQNARSHDGKNIDAICRSLETFGQRKPIVCRRDGDRLVVIAGNGTLEAAALLGWTHLDVVEVPADWDDAKTRAYAVADNRTAELADWNGPELLATLTSLDDEMLTAAGFDGLDVSALERLWGSAPDLNDLLDEVGHPTEEDGMVRVSFLVPVDVAARWEMAVEQAGSGSELENTCTAVQAAFDAIVADQ